MSDDPELKAKTLEAQNLELQIKATDARIAALTVEAKAKRSEAQAKYIESHQARFADVNPALALIGASSPHEVKLFGASYWLTAPSGEAARQADNFAMTPIVKALVEGKNVEEDYGPVTVNEQLLVQWLTALSPPMPEGAPAAPKRDISKLPTPQKLKMIRTLPTQLIAKLAQECDSLNTFLSIVLERELGN
jgi:hypothetical protein